MNDRLGVRKTYKLFVGGAFPRSESGRVYPVAGTDGGTARVAQASRKDVRDAVSKARGAWPSWAAATAYNRGQVLYRVAEVLDGRREQLAAELVAGGTRSKVAAGEVDAAVDRFVWWAGFADKLTAVLGSVNPVAGPFLNVSTPVPAGVVGVVCTPDAPLLGLASLVAPALAAGNTAVVLASEPAPLAPLTFGEVLATSDVPAGVVNILTGPTIELATWLAAHHDVDGLDLTGVPPGARGDLIAVSADSLKRVVATGGGLEPQVAAAFLETRTVWHPARI